MKAIVIIYMYVLVGIIVNTSHIHGIPIIEYNQYLIVYMASNYQIIPTRTSYFGRSKPFSLLQHDTPDVGARPNGPVSEVWKSGWSFDRKST